MPQHIEVVTQEQMLQALKTADFGSLSMSEQIAAAQSSTANPNGPFVRGDQPHITVAAAEIGLGQDAKPAPEPGADFNM